MKRYIVNINVFACTIASGILLSGCSWSAGSPDNARVPTRHDERPETSTVATPEISELRMAKMLFENKDCAKAFRIFKKHAETGDAEAEAWLARCYMNGVGTSVDFEKAYEYFRRAAEKNDPWGINGLGVCTEYGFGTSVNLQTAKNLYHKAANMNHPLGTLNVARTYADKKGGFYNQEQAEKFFKKAVELNATAARSTYADFLFSLKRYSDAISLARESIEEPQSMRIMALCYENGWGVSVDISRAVDLAEAYFGKTGPAAWSGEVCFNAGLAEAIMNGMTEFAKHCFKIAADQGHVESQYVHATNLSENNNKTDALKYMRRAADNGYALAMIETGKLLLEQKDYVQAIRYFSLATFDERTLVDAVSNLSSIYHYKINEPKQGLFWDQKGMALAIDYCQNEIALNEIQQNGDDHFAKAAALFAETRVSDNECAVKWLNDILEKDYERLRALADKGNSDALFALGMIGCLEGKGHPNVAIGMELLEKSAKLNDARACRFLGNIYRNGGLVKKDLKKALEWYRKGADIGDAESARTVALMLFSEEEFKETKLNEFKKAFDKCLELEIFTVAFEYGEVMEFVAKDLKKAEELYRLSAAHDDARAMLHLHDMLLKDNPDEAFQFLWKAVNLENNEAELRMGDIQKIWEQPRNSFIYYLKANLHGDEINAPYRMAECWLTGYGCEVNLNCFWNAANKAYEKGCVEVCYLLGSVYRDGKICPKDVQKAKAYFEEGAKRGSEACKKELKK